jgi:signal transduction histidine kinase
MPFSTSELKAAGRTRTLPYAIALAIVAGLSVATHIILGVVITDQREVAQIVNRTGRQRMLSQRIAWLAPHYATTGDPASRVLLRETIAEMERAAEKLRNGITKAGKSTALPEGIRKIYEHEDVTRRLTAYLAHAQAIADTDIPPGTSGRDGPALAHLTAIMDEASGPILTTLNNIVTEYVLESDTRIDRLQESQRITLVIVILTLIAEALFIFRPLSSGILAYVERVKDLSRRANDAQRANAAKSSFLAHMSHELRTPMTGIIGMTDLLLSGAQSPEHEKIARLLRQSAQNLQDLLNDILDLAKIEAGGVSLESADFKVSDLLQTAHGLFSYAMRAKGLDFTFETPEAPSNVFHGDLKHLQQILNNLISNALKFTEAGYVHIKLWADGSEGRKPVLKLSVSDSGIGISEDNISRLFGKFEQEDSSTARKFGGTGLGLAICKQIVEAMGGKIEVQSTKGKGSTFTVSVPVTRGETIQVESAAKGISPGLNQAPSPTGLNILVADDNATIQFLLKEMLGAWGHRTTIVSNGREVLNAVATGAFDIILMDMQMPEINGEEAARRIRGSGGVSARTPIIAVTADATRDSRDRYLAAGCNAVVTKPLSWELLADEIRTLAGPSRLSVPAT